MPTIGKLESIGQYRELLHRNPVHKPPFLRTIESRTAKTTNQWLGVLGSLARLMVYARCHAR
ncbi:hypothetical protein THIX_60758 [Thiomonas sp. X19]|nr:hypothetical protein THIX_60758 [Thiomonas sp. X19]